MNGMIHRFAWRVGYWFCVFVAAASAGNLLAQPPANRAEDEAAVKQAGKDYVAAMDRGDTKAAAEFWTADGTYTDEAGHTEKVREQLEKSTAAGAKPHSQTKVSNAKIRFVTGDVAIEDADCETTPAGSDGSRERALHGDVGEAKRTLETRQLARDAH